MAQLSNSAKMLRAYMRVSGVFAAVELAAALDMPLRTIQRLKLDIAVFEDANSAKCATHGVNGASDKAPVAPPMAHAQMADDAKCATHGVSSDVPQKEKSPHTPLKEKTNYHLETTVESSQLDARKPKVADAALPASPISDDELENKLLDACNGSLDNPVNCQGLLNLMVPKMWIENGADLERVILPTLRAQGRKHHGKRIRSWDYFTATIAEAKAKAERGIPVVAAPKAPPRPAHMSRY